MAASAAQAVEHRLPTMRRPTINSWIEWQRFVNHVSMAHSGEVWSWCCKDQRRRIFRGLTEAVTDGGAFDLQRSSPQGQERGQGAFFRRVSYTTPKIDIVNLIRNIDL
eukprot:s8588_g1.t2